MLPPANRLRRSYEVLKVIKKGRRLRGKYINLSFLARSRSRIPRFAFMASIKLDKRAVVRNTLKRWAREEIRLLLPNIKPGTDYVLSLVNKPKEHILLKEDLQTILKKV